ncbi:hypothetical protein ACPXCG_12250 [Gordonia sp. DT218]|uniref:hypothetical protein n=1 Tax=Gordonia sp. DT218 TaxID=3416659 RepID=UPI003CF321AA
MTNQHHSRRLRLAPIYGAEPRIGRGISSQGDVLVNSTADGIDLNTIWDEWAGVLEVWNAERTSIASLLSFYTTLRGEAVPQTLAQMKFEEASEYGIPRSGRADAEVLRLGYTFRDFDLRLETTWRYLRDADSRQLNANMNQALEADNRLLTGTVLNRLFNPTPDANEDSTTVFGLYTGDDGIAPPPYMGVEFPETTSHYLVSGAATIDSGDLEDAIKAITSKGYGPVAGSQLVILCNEYEADVIATFRRGEESRTGGPIAKYDFVLSKSAPAYLTEEVIVGQQAPESYKGLPVFGSYGEAFVIKSNLIPAGYVAVAATGGPNSEVNPVAIRQHPNPAYHGLRVIPGADKYPLQNSFLQRSFGTGVRRRGAAAVIQVKETGDYEAPTFAI